MAPCSTPDEAVVYLERILPGVEESNANQDQGRLPLPKRKIGVTILECDGMPNEPSASAHGETYCVLRINNEHKTLTARKKCSDSVYWGQEFVFDVDEAAARKMSVQVRRERQKFKRGMLKKIPKAVRKTLAVTPPKKYDVLGEISLPVTGIPRDGMELWQQLRDTEGDPSPIRLEFRLCFLAEPPVVFSSRAPKKDHYNLSYAFLTRTLLETEDGAFRCKTWEECLPKPAITLLHQNAIHRALTKIDEHSCYIKVIASVRYVGLRRINCAVVHNLLEGLREELNDNPAFRKSMQHVLQQTYHQTCDTLEQFHSDIDIRNEFEALDLHAALWCRGYLATFCVPEDGTGATASK